MSYPKIVFCVYYKGHEIGTSSKEITEGNRAYKEGKFQLAFDLYSAGLKKEWVSFYFYLTSSFIIS